MKWVYLRYTIALPHVDILFLRFLLNSNCIIPFFRKPDVKGYEMLEMSKQIAKIKRLKSIV